MPYQESSQPLLFFVPLSSSCLHSSLTIISYVAASEAKWLPFHIHFHTTQGYVIFLLLLKTTNDLHQHRNVNYLQRPGTAVLTPPLLPQSIIHRSTTIFQREKNSRTSPNPTYPTSVPDQIKKGIPLLSSRFTHQIHFKILFSRFLKSDHTHWLVH